jgi:hypothetical protein
MRLMGLGGLKQCSRKALPRQSSYRRILSAWSLIDLFSACTHRV